MSTPRRQHRRVFPNLRAYLEDQKRHGITQQQFAARMQMSNGYLSDLKQGIVRPSLALAMRLADECGIPIESFLPAERRRVS